MHGLDIKQKGALYGLGAALIWCGFILVSRMGGISELNAYDIVAIRYATCAAILLPIWWFKHRFNLFNVKLTIGSLIGGLAYALCVFRGFQTTPASHAAVLLPGLMPLFIITFSVLLNGDRPSLQKWLGIAAITSGAGALFWSNYSQHQELSSGHAWLVAAGLCWALFTVLIKRWGFTPWQSTVSLAVVTCALYLPVYVLFLPKVISATLWPDILLQGFYQGVLATIVQMILYVKAVQSIGPSSVGSLMSVVPVLSGLLAIFIFNETVTVELMIGLILMSLGAWLAHSRLLNERLLKQSGASHSPVQIK